MRYEVTLYYNVTISKVVLVSAASKADAIRIAKDKALKGDAGEDYYELMVDRPDAVHAEKQQKP